MSSIASPLQVASPWGPQAPGAAVSGQLQAWTRESIVLGHDVGVENWWFMGVYSGYMGLNRWFLLANSWFMVANSWFIVVNGMNSWLIIGDSKQP